MPQLHADTVPFTTAAEAAVTQARARIPVFVDLDGTLVKTDLLVESALAVARAKPWTIVAMAGWLLRGKAHLKARLAQHYDPEPELLPYDQRVCEYLVEQARAGRDIYLATASDASIAARIAEHLALFRGVLATKDGHNLKGPAKLEAIRALANGDFEYIGNEAADLPIWKAARHAVVANAPARVRQRAQRAGNVDRVFDDEGRVGAYLKAMRPHQWLKNLLIFVPLFTAHLATSAQALGHALVAFCAFCLCASATYIVNDLLDLSADRAHPRKRRRPFAAGDISLAHGMLMVPVLLACGFALTALLSWKLTALLAAYLFLTLMYSFVWKSYFLVDAITLAGLYTLRILVGAVAVEVGVSFWLLAFSAFFFYSLALVKRCTELSALEARSQRATRGRDYRTSDATVLQSMGVASGYASVLVFALYIDNPEVAARYGTPQLLWLVCGGLLYWISRMWVKTARGEMHDDPLVYAVKDRGGRLVILAMLAVSGLAYVVRL